MVWIGLGLLAAGCSRSSGGTGGGSLDFVTHVDAAGAEKRIKEGKVIVLDVRTPKEFANGHLAEAKLIDFQSPDFAKKLGELDRSKTYLVHCAVGGRSTQSLATFQKLGFKDVVHLDGGFKAWQKAGNPIEK